MANYNKIVMIGHITRDAEKPHESIAKCGIGFNEAYKRNDEWVNVPHFFNLVSFGMAADAMMDKCKKGAMVLVEGMLVQNKWEDGEGNQKSSVEVKVFKVLSLDKNNGAIPSGCADSPGPGEDDDIPL